MKLPSSPPIAYSLIYLVLLLTSISLHLLLLPFVPSPLLRLYTIDFFVTCILFVIGNFLLSSNSIYDLHWPLTPWISSVYFYFTSQSAEPPLATFLPLFVLVSIWSGHLIWQTMSLVDDVKHEDWRYQLLRRQYESNFLLFAFFALHVLPMLEVLIGSSAIYYICAETKLNQNLTFVDTLLLLLIGGGVLLENIADRQLAEFRRHRKKSREHRFAVLSSGVWKYSRHPNYLGELIFWWGLFLLGRAHRAPWWCAVGPLLVTLMMLFGSIPISEERLFRKYPEYKFVQRRVAMLIPTFDLLG